jgi:putative peptide zinc metalloprotease protein
VLTAPRDGYVMGSPSAEDKFKPWEKADMDKPFCHIGDTTKLRMLVPVSPDDYSLIKTDLARKKKNGQDLLVTVRIHGFGSQTWPGRVVHVPTLADKTVPLQLTTKGGGPLAMKPGSDPNDPEVQGQVYLIGIDFETKTERAVSPGTLGQAKIHCEYRSAAWWAWRTISGTFDLGLW